MKWRLEYTKQALKFLERTPGDSVESLDPHIRKAIQKVVFREHTNINIQKMKGKWKEYYRIRQGDLRIIIRFEVGKQTVLIYRIGWRGDVYK